MVVMQDIAISTSQKVELQNITPLVQGKVASSGVGDGWCYLFVPHTTAGITINEQADPDVARDIIAQLDRSGTTTGTWRGIPRPILRAAWSVAAKCWR